MSTTGVLLGGRYRLAELLGAGASAQVFLADDDILRRRVAVKVLHPALASDEAFLRRFRAEARAAAALSHPNLLAVYDWGEDTDGPYLVLEHLAGGSLRAMLDSGARLSPSQAVLVGLEAARGLEAAHRTGFVHRDIKPANLLFGADGRLRIADFGVARALSESGWTEHDGLVGTARYAAPEQARTGRVDGGADLYALGLVLVEAVTGEVPLAMADAFATLVVRADTDIDVPAELGPLGPVVARMLQRDPTDRPAAADVVDALLAVSPRLPRPAPLPLLTASPASDATIAAPVVRPALFDDATVSSPATRRVDPTGPLPHVAARRRRWPWLLLAAAIVAAAAVGAVAFDRLRVPEQVVPEVAGQTLPRATEILQAAEDRKSSEFAWKVERRDAFHDEIPAGNVIRQSPEFGKELEDGGTIELVVSKGPVPVPVPRLEGLTDAEAVTALAAQKLVKGAILEPRFHESIETGRVVTWSVAGLGERPPDAPRGSKVDLVLSKGKSPRVIEDVTADSPEEARKALTAQGFVVTVVEAFSDTVPAGKVIGTDPPAGRSVPFATKVSLKVSKGQDLVAVPDVSKFATLQQAVEALEAAGLVAGDVEGPARGRPFDSNPEAGKRVKRGSEVDIYLRR